MKSFIRWKGLLAFLAITALLLVFFLLIADNLVEKTIESAGTRIVGARVELAEVDLSFFPAGMYIMGIQITNPDAPMKNAAEISRLTFSLNLMDLLWKKIIINQMTADNVRFNTDRTTSGAIPGKTEKKKKETTRDEPSGKAGGFSLPSFATADIQTILEREQLASVQEIQQLRKDIETKKEAFRQRLETLPDEEKFREYEARLKKLENTKRDVLGILGGMSEASGLYKDIKADLAKIQATKQEVTATARDFETRIRQIPQLAKKDVQDLKNKYGLSPEGMGNLTEQLFGPRWAQWVRTGLAWYEKLQPLLDRAKETAERKKKAAPPQPERGEGIDVPFPEYSPRPDLLIRLANVSVSIPQGNLTGTIRDVSSDQTLTGRPLAFDFTAEKMENLKNLSVKGALDHTNPEHPRDSLTARAESLRITDITVSESNDLPVVLDQGQVDLQVAATIENRLLDSRAEIVLTDTRFADQPGAELNRMASSLLGALSEVPRIALNADIRGPLDNYSVAVSSNIDKVMKQAVADIIRQESRALEEKLQQAVTARTQEKLQAVNLQVEGMDAITRELTDRLQLGNRLLKR